mmetsp:Transcript_29965/g.62636  ORF Transcript_29965/g.62636 Transcript_29965/m.62636 type:complete len:93 (+) Transcript_29965:2672-2950(+)
MFIYFVLWMGMREVDGGGFHLGPSMVFWHTWGSIGTVRYGSFLVFAHPLQKRKKTPLASSEFAKYACSLLAYQPLLCHLHHGDFRGEIKNEV